MAWLLAKSYVYPIAIVFILSSLCINRDDRLPAVEWGNQGSDCLVVANI
jgi:hypothetical protein